MKIESIFDKITLNNGYQMPRFGFGPKGGSEAKDDNDVKTLTGDKSTRATFFLEKDSPSFDEIMYKALELGVRSFDTGARYGSEKDIGKIIRECGIDRKELFITTKLNNTMHGYDKTMEDFENSFNKIGLDYIDMYLIHCPIPMKGAFIDSWRAITELYKQGRIKAIGVSNFGVKHLYDLADTSDIVPVVNQMEQNPFYVRHDLLAYMNRHNIIAQSYSPLGGAGGRLAGDTRLEWLADKYNKTGAQIIYRWHLQKGFMVAASTRNIERLKQITDIYDFELSDEDMAYLETVNRYDKHWHDPYRFAGTYASTGVQIALVDEFNRLAKNNGFVDAKEKAIFDKFNDYMSYEDSDGTKDYVIACFFRANAKYGKNLDVEENAQKEARLLAKEMYDYIIKNLEN